MAIVKCSECGKDVSNKAESCIHCGAPISEQSKPSHPDKSKETKKAVAIFAVLVVFAVLFSMSDDDQPAEAINKTPTDKGVTSTASEASTEEAVNASKAETADDEIVWNEPVDVVEEKTVEDTDCNDFDCRVDKAMYIAPTACKPAIERLSKYDYEWTDKWYETVFTRYMPVDGQPNQARLIGDKIKFQNGFGAWANMIYICTYDLDANAVVSVAADQGRL